MQRKDITSWIAIGLTLAIAIGGNLVTYGANQADLEHLKQDSRVTQDMRARQERIDERTLSIQRKQEELIDQQRQILNLLLRTK